MNFWPENDDVVRLVVEQLRGGPLPIRPALESCNRTILILRQRIATAQKQLADQEVIRDLLTAASEEQQQPQNSELGTCNGV